MLVLLSGPSSAFTLASPSLARSVAAANIEPVYWHHWGWHHWGWHHWHHWGWHRWGWHHWHHWY
jgi:hypothetical protein